VFLHARKLSSELDRLRQQLQEEKRLREQAEERAISEQRLREEEQRYYKQRTAKRSLAEFLILYRTRDLSGSISYLSPKTYSFAWQSCKTFQGRVILIWTEDGAIPVCGSVAELGPIDP
jgi:hypothetical protein